MTDKVHPVEILIEILRKEKFYAAKFIDCFVDQMHAAQQRGFLDFLVEKVQNARWERMLADPYQWTELVKAILYHYSGRENIKSEPSKHDLIALIEEYKDSKEFTLAENDMENEGKPSFTEMIGDINGEA